MVGKSENIYTDFDYNNITIVDPNKVVDEFGNVKERFLNQEDLVMYANLECNMIPRTRLALGTSNDDSSITTVSIASINFLKPGGKEFLDNSYTDELTGKDTIKGLGLNQNKVDKGTNKQKTYSNGKEGVIDTGLLGITNITISNDTSFMTQITMRLVDVKGRALFESGGNSPYAAFFTLPYPKFYLTVKGFLGKAIRLELMLHTFSSTYDSYTGNFDVQLSFFSYKFTVLAEISMGMVLATPHMYNSQIQVKGPEGVTQQLSNQTSNSTPVSDGVVQLGTQKIREMYSEYKSKGLIPEDFPEISIIELQFRLENFIKNILDSFTSQDLKPLSDIESYINNIKEYRGEVYNFISPQSWFNKYMDTKNPYILNDDYNTKIYTFKTEINPQTQETAVSELKGLIDKFNNLLKINETLGENGSYTINGQTKKSSIPVDISYDNNFVYTVGSVNEINFRETFKLVSGNTKSTDIESLKNDFQKRDFFGSTIVIGKDGQKNNKINFFRFDINNVETNNKVRNFNNSTFIGKIDGILKEVEKRRQQIQDDLTKALTDILQSSNNDIGFVPNIRNVLAVFFASTEAFLRLLDDVHKEAWNQRDSSVRKSSIFDKEVAEASVDNINSGFDKNTPVYPWPQFLVRTNGENGQEIFELRYPGDNDVVNRTQAFQFDIWPEVEFIEEFIKAYAERDNRPISPTTKDNNLKQTNRFSLNAIEFPINNVVFFNKEEVKFLFEIYERILLVSNYSKLSRFNNSISDSDKVTNIIANGENFNILNALGDNNPFISKTLKEYGFNATNYLTALRHFSNDGTGQSWQNYLKGIFNTSYIKNITENSQFEFINDSLLDNQLTQPEDSPNDIASINEIISNSTKSNNFDFTDLYPYINDNWCKTGLSDGKSILNALNAFSTEKVLKYNDTQKVITNFDSIKSKDKVKPFNSFIFKKSEIPSVNNTEINYLNLSDLKKFYQDRTVNKQLVTEGNLEYINYIGNLDSQQTTSILNTPFFINSIAEGVTKFRNLNQYPYVTPAYLFINSLPLSTLREKYVDYNGNYETLSFTELNYIFATIKKFGAIHKVPYPWILKYGSIWHRYKVWIESGVDILDSSWSDFNFSENFDPINQDISRVYPLIYSGTPIDIVLQKNTIIGTETSTLINTGFYPKLINDFNVFYQGFMIFSGYTDNEIQSGVDSGINLRYVDDSFIDFSEGFDPNNDLRDLRIIPWSIDINSTDGQNTFLFPSHGAVINQTKDECFKDGKIVTEVNDNKEMYNGSVRLFWAASQYGYFDTTRLTKPTPEEYLKKIITDKKEQQNFTINGISGYTNISEMFSVFEKETLDLFEQEFLNFSKSRYDFVESGVIPNTSMTQNLEDESQSSIQIDSGNKKIDSLYKNFHLMMIEMMKVPKSNLTIGEDVILEYQKIQTENITNIIDKFLNLDIVFKNGNPSNYDRRLFGSFTSLKVENSITWDSYKNLTPDSLPSLNNTITLSQSQLNYPDAWKALKTYVGFSDLPELVYDDNGSFITDFFIDFDVVFTENNIVNLHRIIKIYASQKLEQYQLTPTPPILPNISNSNGTVLETINYSNGTKIIVFKDNDKKFTALIDGNNKVVTTGQKVDLTEDPNNEQIVSSILISVYGNLITAPLVVSRIVEPTPQYPLLPNPQGKWSFFKFTNSIDEYVKYIENFQGKIIDNLFQQLRKNLKSVVIQDSQIIQTSLDGKQSKIDLWETFKVLNDKWIAGNDYKNKTLFEDVLLLDRASRNIGEKILVDIYKLRKTITEISPTNSMIGIIQEILLDNNFVTMYVPGYVNFYNVQNATKNPKPRLDSVSDFANNMFGTFLNVDYRESSTKMVNFYAGKPSEFVDIKDNADYLMNDDSFSITKSQNNPVVENQINKNDFDKSNKVAGFNVDIGPQNQSIFYGFNVSQDNHQNTADALEVINQMANQTNGKLAQTQNISLYNLYKSRSYTCNLIMLGNAMIQPTMYFNLRHVPMFHGPYMVLKVTHTITPGNFETVVSGVRQPIASLPKIDEYVQKLKTNLLNSVLEENNRQREVIDKKLNDAQNIKNETQLTNNNATTNPTNTSSANQSCTANTQYGAFINEQPVNSSFTTNEMANRVKTIISSTTGIDSTQQNNLGLIVFSSIYISSWNGTGFQANNNNFIGLNIQNYWGQSPYFNNKFFCSSDNQPFASFNNVDDNIKFLVERWKLRMQFPLIPSQTLVVNEDDIAKFWIINFDANSTTTNRQEVYDSYPASDLSILKSKITEAIGIYRTATGQLIQSSPPVPPQLLSITKTVIGELKFTITINDTTGNKWNMIIAEYKVDSPNECADNDYINNITNLISNDKQSVSIPLEDIQTDSDCENTSVGSVKFRITLNPVLSDGITLDQNRSQNSQVIIGNF